MYPLLREFIRREYNMSGLRITTRISVDNSKLGISLRIACCGKFKGYVYDSVYLWDCIRLEGIPLPDDVCREVSGVYAIIESSWKAFQIST